MDFAFAFGDSLNVYRMHSSYIFAVLFHLFIDYRYRLWFISPNGSYSNYVSTLIIIIVFDICKLIVLLFFRYLFSLDFVFGFVEDKNGYDEIAYTKRLRKNHKLLNY